ncbi:MAG TPA: hypothetical protein G4N94_10650 [Caldilineae bacterium]|nr:hypothetical protein [Caldilineae bacterium]
MSDRRFFLLILLIYLALAVSYAVVEPLGEAPDETDHYAYIRHLGLNRSLPEGPSITQGKHPPLYHGLAAAMTAWTGLDFEFLCSNPDAFPPGPDAPPNFFIHTTLESFPWQGGALAMHLARFLSIAFGAVTLWATWRTGAEAFPEQAEIGLLAAAFLAGLPAFLFISASINNDNAAGAFGALALLLCIRINRRGASFGRSLWLGLVLGLGLLSKVGTLALWPLVAMAMAGAFWPERDDGRAWLRMVGNTILVWVIGVLVAAPWLLRNWRLYGDPLGWDLVRATIDQRTGPVDFGVLLWLFRGIYEYFWGRFGAIGQIRMPAWFYVVAVAITIALLAGAIRWLLKNRRGQNRFSILLLAFTPLLVLVGIIRYTAIAQGTDQARLLWPAIGVIAVWAGVGVAGLAQWSGLNERIRARSLVAGFAAVMAIYGFFTLALVVRPAFAPPPPVIPASTPEQALATFGEQFELLAAELPEQALAVGDPTPVQLLWRANAPLTDDLRVVVRLVHQDGWLAAERDHSPADGRYATDRWQPGEAILDSYVLSPNPQSAGVFIVEVGVRPFRGDWLPVLDDGEAHYFAVGEVSYQ